MKSEVLVILGSSREDSNTLTAVKNLCPFAEYELLDLRNFNINHYNYDHKINATDDFHSIASKLDVAHTVIFATPVYWYSMTGRMKVLFDRFTELLSTYKEVGKRLRTKKCYVISCGTDAELPEGFEVPFRLTAKYFNMEYCGALYLKS
jgi:multimeric flavodoxin WrbA